MTRVRTLAQRLRRAGVRDVERALEWIGAGEVSLLGDGNEEQLLGVAGDPDQAILALVRLNEVGVDLGMLADPQAQRRLVALLGASRAAGDYILTHPEILPALAADPPHLPHDPARAQAVADAAREELTREFLADIDATQIRPGVWVAPAGGSDRLRCSYRRHLYALAAADLTDPHPESLVAAVTARLSALADAAVEAALALARGAVDPTAEIAFAVIALGKTGACELNYLSDVDVIFVTDTTNTDAPRTLERASRLAVALSQVVSGPGAQPPLWELDLGLRPEGADGALVRTADSYRDYYRTWAKNWEFQALLKARPQAGDLELAQHLLDDLSPLVWSASTREGFVEDARAMRARVEAHIPAHQRDHQLKLGPGGLRDVEFSVQLLQLVHGRTDPSVRPRSTLEAIAALAAGGYIGREAAEELASCYRFVRVLEHRGQLERMRRTQVLSTREADLRRIGRTLGEASLDAAALGERWHRVRARVRALHQDLFYRPLLGILARAGAQEVGLSAQGARERLRFLGYRDPDGAVRHMEALTAGVSRRAAIQRQLMPGILEWLTHGPDPDQGFLAFRRLSDEIGSSHWYLGLLRDSRVAAQRLCRILATSPYVAERMAAEGQSVKWLDDDEARAAPSREGLVAEIEAVLGRHSDVAEACERLRAVRSRELLRTAIDDVALGIDPVRTGAAISRVNDVCVAGALSAIRASVPGASEHVALMVVAMGRQGGEEASYGSDADLVVVFEPKGATSESEGAAIAREVATALRDHLGGVGATPAMRIDYDLRPEGRQGALVRSIDSYVDYYTRWASTWERQALLRARDIAGEEDLRLRWRGVRDRVCFARGLERGEEREIRVLKARMETERLPRGVEPARHVKLGPGGLADVEWVVQLHQLRHGCEIPAVRAPSTLVALENLRQGGIIGATDAEILAQAWRMASAVRAGNVLAHANVSPRAIDVVPAASRDVITLGRLLGYAPGNELALEEDYRRYARRGREVVERLFYDG